MVAAGGALINTNTNNILESIKFIITIIIYVLSTFLDVLKSLTIILLQQTIINMMNVSTDKNSYRLVYKLFNNHDNYYLKISPSDKKEHKNETIAIPINNLRSDDVGSYVYECLIYDEMKKHTGVNYKGKDLSKYVSEIVDWGINKLITGDKPFMVNLNGTKIDINKMTTFGDPPIIKGLGDSILTNRWEDFYSPAMYDNNVCYSIVKVYDGFEIFYEYLTKNNNYDKLLDIYKNLGNIIRLFYENKQFRHMDLHAGNLLVNEITGEIKLFDFDLSEVNGSISDLKTRLNFMSDGQVLVKPVFGHLYDYYRGIIESLDYIENRDAVLFAQTGHITVPELLVFFNRNHTFTNFPAGHYTSGEIRRDNIKMRRILRSNPDSDYNNFQKTIEYFNNTL
jgi:hypothetical protein